MLFSDALTLDAPRPLQGGALAVRARAARTGVYQYAGREVDPDNRHGLRDTAMVNVLRDEAAVFDERAVRSFIGKPITDDHPSAPVTADNWRDHARGTIMGAVRDGDYLAFDLLLTDAATVTKVNGGKRELSNGYACDVEVGAFTAADGTKCQARQKPGSIVGNHVALVDRGRAGSECAICDAIPSSILDSLTTQEKPVKTMLIDGLTVDIANADTAHATITTILAARDTANNKVASLETQVATLTAEKTTLDAKVVTLEQAVKDAKPTPAQLRDAGKALVLTAGKAKALGVTVSDEMDEAAIVKAVVDAKVKPELRAGWNDGQYAASFAVLADGVQVAVGNGVQPLHAPVIAADQATAYVADRDKQRRALSDAWRTPFNPAEAAA